MSARKGKGRCVCGRMFIPSHLTGGYLSRKGGMKAPKCRLCKHEHWNNEPHVFATNDVANTVNTMANTVVNSVANKSTYKYRDAEKRRAYQRDLMRKKRAGV
jgi:hypothetical protein